MSPWMLYKSWTGILSLFADITFEVAQVSCVELFSWKGTKFMEFTVPEIIFMHHLELLFLLLCDLQLLL